MERFYFVTLQWKRLGDSDWVFQNDIIDVHPLAYLRRNVEASDQAVKRYEEYKKGGKWQQPTVAEEYVLRFWAEITREQYDEHKAWEERERE